MKNTKGKNPQYHSTYKVNTKYVKTKEQEADALSEAIEFCASAVMKHTLVNKLNLKDGCVSFTGFVSVKDGDIYFRAGIDDNPTPFVLKAVDMDKGVKV